MSPSIAHVELAKAVVDAFPQMEPNHRTALVGAIANLIDAKISAQHPSVPLILTGAAPAPMSFGEVITDICDYKRDPLR